MDPDLSCAEDLHPLLPRVTQSNVERNVGRLTDWLNRFRDRRRDDGTRRLAITALDLALYRAVAYYALCFGTGVCSAGHRALAAAVGCANSAVGDALRRLAAAGFLDIIYEARRTAKGLRWHCRYRLHPVPVWRTPEEIEAILSYRPPRLRRADTLRAEAREQAALADQFDAMFASADARANGSMCSEFERTPSQTGIESPIEPESVPRSACARLSPPRHLPMAHRAGEGVQGMRFRRKIVDWEPERSPAAQIAEMRRGDPWSE